MLAMPQAVGYSVLALVCLDPPEGDWRGGQAIAEATGVPKPYLSKLLHGLRQAGLVSAKRGYGGGFKLAKPRKQISLMDAIEALEGGAWEHRCLLGLSHCSDQQPCPVHHVWSQECKRIEKHLRKLTLADITHNENKHGFDVNHWLLAQGKGLAVLDHPADG